MRYTLIVIFLSALLLTGCASAADTPVETKTSAPKSNLATPVIPKETKTATPTINLATEVESTSVEKNEITTTITPSPTDIDPTKTTKPTSSPTITRIEPTSTLRPTKEPTQSIPSSIQNFDFQSKYIAFTYFQHYPKDIYILNLENFEEIRLIDNPEFSKFPAWSPDGSMIAFESLSVSLEYLEMFVMNINTKEVFTKIENVNSFSWSNDGEKIIYAFGDYNNYSNTLYIMTTKDWKSRVLFDTEWLVWRLYWSPVEDKILAQVDDDGPGGSGAESLYIIELNGSVRKLPIEVVSSIWSEDGKKVIYSTLNGLEAEIRHINIDGSQDERLVKYHCCLVGDPKLSPSGEWLAFERQELAQPSVIFILNLWNKELIQVTKKDLVSYSYSWSPNGKYLAYLQPLDDWKQGCSLHVFSLETHESLQIIDKYVDCYEVVWQP
jgi:Tol biopolymer transport system component